jgi:hypothetical protein
VSLSKSYAFEGGDDKARVVPVQPAQDSFYDDPPEADDDKDRAELLFRICDLIARGPRKSFPVRLAALRMIAGHEPRPVRAVADELDVSHSTVLAAVAAIKERLKSTRTTEVRRS